MYSIFTPNYRLRSFRRVAKKYPSNFDDISLNNAMFEFCFHLKLYFQCARLGIHTAIFQIPYDQKTFQKIFRHALYVFYKLVLLQVLLVQVPNNKTTRSKMHLVVGLQRGSSPLSSHQYKFNSQLVKQLDPSANIKTWMGTIF